MLLGRVRGASRKLNLKCFGYKFPQEYKPNGTKERPPAPGPANSSPFLEKLCQWPLPLAQRLVTKWTYYSQTRAF